MSITASTSFFFKPEIANDSALNERVNGIILNITPFIEATHQNEMGMTIYLGDVNYDDHSEIIDALKDAKIEAECMVSDCTDTSIEDFSIELINEDGEMVTSTITKSGKRVVQELELCLNEINNGASMEDLKAFIEEKIKMAC